MNTKKITTLGALKKSGYTSTSIQEELAQNLRHRLQKREPTFTGLIGYEKTVIPDVERAILSGHNINLLGLRGQAKTRLARQMTGFQWLTALKSMTIPYTPLAENLGKK